MGYHPFKHCILLTFWRSNWAPQWGTFATHGVIRHPGTVETCSWHQLTPWITFYIIVLFLAATLRSPARNQQIKFLSLGLEWNEACHGQVLAAICHDLSTTGPGQQWFSFPIWGFSSSKLEASLGRPRQQHFSWHGSVLVHSWNGLVIKQPRVPVLAERLPNRV